MKIRDFINDTGKIIKQSKGHIVILIMMNVVALYLLQWAVLNYASVMGDIHIYKSMIQWPLTETVNIQVRIPGIDIDDDYADNVLHFVNELNTNEEILLAGMYGVFQERINRMDSLNMYQNMDVEIFSISPSIQDLCNLKLSETVPIENGCIPVYVGSDYDNIPLGTHFKLLNREGDFVVAGRIKKGSRWLGTLPFYGENMDFSLDSMFLIEDTGWLNLWDVPGFYNSIYVRCKTDDFNDVQQFIYNSSCENNIMCITTTAQDSIKELKASNKEEIEYVTWMSIYCLILCLFSIVVTQMMFIKKQSYNIAVQLAYGYRRKWFIHIIWIVCFFQYLLAFLISFLIFKPNLAESSIVELYGKTVLPSLGIIILIETMFIYILLRWMINRINIKEILA